MGEHQRGFDGEGAEHLGGGAVVEIVEAATQRLPVDGDADLTGVGEGSLQHGSVTAESGFQGSGVKLQQDVADGRVRRRTAPGQGEGRIQGLAVLIDEDGDVTIAIGACDDGEDGEQQNIAKLVTSALCPPGIGDVLQQGEQRGECSHGNLQLGCRARS